MSRDEQLAEEYKHSADVTLGKINEIKFLKRHGLSTPEQERRLFTLYGMYSNCMLCYKELMRKARKRCE